MLTRFGVLGDIHTEDEHLALALETLREKEVEAVLSVGDIVDGMGDADRTCSLLRDAGVIAVAGNHDRWLVNDRQLGFPDDTTDLHETHRAWLASLPKTRRFDSALGGVLLCHGVGEDDMQELRPHTDELSMKWMDGLLALQRDPDVALMIGGHTHERMVRALEGLTVINAGTLHRDFAVGFLLVDLSQPGVQAYDIHDGVVHEAETYLMERGG